MRPARIAILAAVAASLVAAALGAAYLHNQLVALDVAADTQWKQVENQLVRQHELLPKLVGVTLRYATHEKDVLQKLFDSRARYVAASAQDGPRVAERLDGDIVQVLAIAENYPELKADGQFRDLSYEIAGTKNRIAVERQRYNEIVGLLNTRLRQLPWSLVAFGLDEREFYQAPGETLAEPDLGL
jgi:LemA protein